MPEKLQPGPITGRISFFAPVSLLFFFFVLFIFTTLRGIDLHPMNYFFLACAFFSFHLLMAYLADIVPLGITFVICSCVSVLLLVSYLRLVAGMQGMAYEAGLAQFVYLILFSFAFFFDGFTGLAITVGAIVTLFVAMQTTARVSWSEKFATPNTTPFRATH
jgi:inner membrane protein involved in colicin E2 resistance